MTDLTPEQKAMCDISYLTKRKKEKNAQPERKLQKRICQYLQTHYPDVYFFSDPSGIKLSPGILQLLKQTRSRHSQLDIVILDHYQGFNGLILEVKAESPFKNNSELKSDKHLEAQAEVMQMLTVKGYCCRFVWDFDRVVDILNKYLGEPKTDNTPLF